MVAPLNSVVPGSPPSAPPAGRAGAPDAAPSVFAALLAGAGETPAGGGETLPPAATPLPRGASQPSVDAERPADAEPAAVAVPAVPVVPPAVPDSRVAMGPSAGDPGAEAGRGPGDAQPGPQAPSVQPSPEGIQASRSQASGSPVSRSDSPDKAPVAVQERPDMAASGDQRALAPLAPSASTAESVEVVRVAAETRRPEAGAEAAPGAEVAAKGADTESQPPGQRVAGTDPAAAVLPAGAASGVVVTAAAGAQEPVRAGLPVSPERPAVADIRPGRAATVAVPESADGADSGSDIESLMRSVQQADRKPLPEGILKALEAQRQRLDRQGAPVTNALQPVRPVTVAPAPAGDVPTAQADILKTVPPAGQELIGMASEEGGDVPMDETLPGRPQTQTSTAGARVAVPAGQHLPQGLAPGTPAWGQALGERLLIMSAGKLQAAEIHLDPPELGSLQIRLQVNQDQVSLSISSPHAQVRDALEQQMPRLREMLAEQGLNLENGTVADDSGRRQARSGGEAPADWVFGPEADLTEPETATPVALSRRSLVDQYV